MRPQPSLRRSAPRGAPALKGRRETSSRRSSKDSVLQEVLPEDGSLRGVRSGTSETKTHVPSAVNVSECGSDWFRRTLELLSAAHSGGTAMGDHFGKRSLANRGGRLRAPLDGGLGAVHARIMMKEANVGESRGGSTASRPSISVCADVRQP